MKKFVVFLALFFVVIGGLFAQNRVSVDLSQLESIRNPVAFTRQFDFWGVNIEGAVPSNVNWTQMNRIIVRVKYFRGANGQTEIRQGSGIAHCHLFYDYSGNWFDAGNIAIPRIDNIGLTGPAPASQDQGRAISLTRAPAGIVFQNAAANVTFIEIQEITFFRE